MKTISLTNIALTLGLIYSVTVSAQRSPGMEDYLECLPRNLELVENSPHKYLMTVEYFNKDIYGNLRNKIKVTGEYTRGFKDKHVIWNNVYFSQSNSKTGPYTDKTRQDYMENFSYTPSSNIVQESFFETFDNSPVNIHARNLIWDMTPIEAFAWNYFDSLQLNKTYIVPDIQGSFDLADIGTYDHTTIELTWIGISMMNNTLCAVIEYRALENKLDIQTDFMNSKGSESYWGKTWVSLENKQIEYAEMYSNTIQEMEIDGLDNNMLISTTRTLTVERIKQIM